VIEAALERAVEHGMKLVPYGRAAAGAALSAWAQPTADGVHDALAVPSATARAREDDLVQGLGDHAARRRAAESGDFRQHKIVRFGLL
jgi:hypothetical protein